MNTIIEEAEQYEFTNGKYGFIAGAKWQQEQDNKMYSEEDMRKAFNGFKSGKSFNEWLEQFKNK
jgi:hypothetical protein